MSATSCCVCCHHARQRAAPRCAPSRAPATPPPPPPSITRQRVARHACHGTPFHDARQQSATHALLKIDARSAASPYVEPRAAAVATPPRARRRQTSASSPLSRNARQRAAHQTKSRHVAVAVKTKACHERDKCCRAPTTLHASAVQSRASTHKHKMRLSERHARRACHAYAAPRAQR